MRRIQFILPLALTAGFIACSSDSGNNTVIDNDSGTPVDSGKPNTDSGAVDANVPTYDVGGTVTGLAGTGLKLKNGSDIVTIAPTDTTFKLPTKLASGTAFAVTVDTQPSNPTQVCVVTGGTGTVASGDVTSIAVNCTTKYTIGGTVSGLAGSGLVLQNNAGDDVTVNANGSFAFATPEATGAAYAVTIKTQPTTPWQTCTLTNATGTVAAANVTDVAVVCTTNKYTVGGTVSGLTGSGLVLQNNGADNLSVAAAATSFTFATSVDSGAAYAATVLTQPTSPSQTCVFANGSGTVAGANVTAPALTCTTNKYKVKVNVTGINGQTVVLQNNGGNDLSVTADGAAEFTTTINSGAAYAVTVRTQPSDTQLLCAVAAPASGTIAAADVTVNVSCARNRKVFITSTAYDGNMGGLAGADAKCQAHATAAGLPGTYKAWLSTLDGQGPANRFTKYEQPYVLVNGTQVWSKFSDIASQVTLSSAVNKTETGGAPPQDASLNGVPAMLTNSSSSGFAYANGWGDCGGFTNTSGSTVHGNYTSIGGSSWTAYYGNNCTQKAGLVCFQQ